MHGTVFRIGVAKWLPFAVVTVGVTLFAYIGLAQQHRMQLNDPQVQMVEDAVDALASGKVPADVVPRGVFIDPTKSLAPFIGIYDESGAPLESNGVLGGTSPTPPVGVFTAALEKGENRVTWQPEGSVRIALVVKPVPNSKGWFVAAGRSMREGETRIDYLSVLAFATVLSVLTLTLALELFGTYRHARATATHV